MHHEDVGQRREQRGERHREQDVDAAEQQPDRADADQDDQRREPDGVSEDVRVDDVVLEETKPEDGDRGEERVLPVDRQPDQHRCRGGEQGTDYRHDLEEPCKRAEQQPVRQADQRERGGEDSTDERDHQELAANVGAELQVDQVPGLTHDQASASRDELEHELLGPVALEDPVRGGREDEEDRDEHLDGLRRDRDRRMDQRGSRRQLLELSLDADEEVVLDAGRVIRRLAKLARRRRHVSDGGRELIDRGRNRQPEQQPDRDAERGEVEKHADRARHAEGAELVDARPHRGRHREPEQEQKDEQPQLPERQRPGDDADHDHRRDECPHRGAHGAITGTKRW